MAFAQAAHRPIPGAVATLGVNERVAFIRRTYAHLAGAIVAFILLEAMFLDTTLAYKWTAWAFFSGGWNWLAVLGLFMVTSWIAERMAFSARPRSCSTRGLGLFIVAEVIIFAPLLLIAQHHTDPNLIAKAAVITLATFGGSPRSCSTPRRTSRSCARILAHRRASRRLLLIVIGVIFTPLVLGTVLRDRGHGRSWRAGFILYSTSRSARPLPADPVTWPPRSRCLPRVGDDVLLHASGSCCRCQGE